MRIIKLTLMVAAAAGSLLLSGCGGGGSGNGAGVTPEPQPPVANPEPPTAPAAPTVSLETDSAAVTSGDSFTLSWSSTDATSCEASGSWTGTLDATGSLTQQAYGLGERSFSITCSGDGGEATSSPVVIQFEISPAQQASAAAVSAAFSIF